MIKISLNVTKITKERLVIGAKGKYLNAVLFEKPDSFGNDGFVSEDVSKDECEAGTRGQIIGNWKQLGVKPAAPKKESVAPAAKPTHQQKTHDETDNTPLPF